MIKKPLKEDKRTKLPLRIWINIGIFVILAVLFAALPRAVLLKRFTYDENRPYYADESFAYIIHNVCPCHEGDDACSGYWACGADKANITYNLDTASEEVLDVIKRDAYFDGLIKSAMESSVSSRIMLLCDLSYLLSFLSLISGIIYWNHNKATYK